MRRVGSPVEVQTECSRPRRIRWKGEVVEVRELLVTWVLETGWWRPGGGERRVYYRLQADGGVLEVYRTQDGAWTLSRIAD